jgi:hypothetical protein
MQPYKSIFLESTSDVVASVDEAKQLFDISNLEWGKDLKSKTNFYSLDYQIPKGWRLPTIQELYTAYVLKVPGFKNEIYWSSGSLTTSDFAWAVNFKWGEVSDKYKKNENYVRCVRDI